MIGQRLVVVGGVWLQAEGVPGIAVIDLITGSSMEFQLDTVSQRLPLKTLNTWNNGVSDGCLSLFSNPPSDVGALAPHAAFIPRNQLWP